MLVDQYKLLWVILFTPKFGKLILERKRLTDDVKRKKVMSGQKILFNIFERDMTSRCISG